MNLPDRTASRCSPAFWAVVLAALAYLLCVQILTIRQESPTGDEPLELAAGYSYLQTGDFRLNPEHPPLSKIFAALPLLAFQPILPLDSNAWAKADEAAFGAEFFHANTRRADAMLFAARIPSIFLTACLGLAIALWARAAFGIPAAILALTLYTFDPNVTAYGRYLKNDIALTLFSYLAVIAWGAHLEDRRLRTLAAAGLLLGMALSTKFSALFLIPVMVILYVIHEWRSSPSASWRRGAGSLLAAFGIAAAFTAMVYAVLALPHGARLGGIDLRLLRNLLDRDQSHAMARLLSRGLLRMHPYWEGLLVSVDHNTIGHGNYLLGMQRTNGWWYYFPIAFAVKTPLCTLILLALAAGLCLRRPLAFFGRTAPFSAFVLAAPLVVYSAFSLTSHLDIGIRHLLPVWPFLFLLAAGVLTRVRLRYARVLVALLCAGLVAESLSIYPDYTAFFQILAGGPAHGPEILLDSNIDWGQDAGKLSRWVSSHRVSSLCLDYWGAADTAALGLNGPPLPATWETRKRETLDCTAAISVNRLYDLAGDAHTHAWVRNLSPVARIGYSIYIYDLRKNASGE